MQLISKSKLFNAAAKYPSTQIAVQAWYQAVKSADWKNLEEVKRTYRDTEAVGNFTVFNLKGNQYRLIVGIKYETGKVFFKYFLTHAEYDKDQWKNDLYF